MTSSAATSAADSMKSTGRGTAIVPVRAPRAGRRLDSHRGWTWRAHVD